MKCPYCNQTMNKYDDDQLLYECGCGAYVNSLGWFNCPECNHILVELDKSESYEIVYLCSNCDYEDSDSYIDVYGSMSVPWGGC